MYYTTGYNLGREIGSADGVWVIVAFIIAIIGAIIIVKNLNIYITNELGYPLHLLSFGLVSTGIMLGISLLVAFLGTFIPVFLIARKKPVDSLRSN